MEPGGVELTATCTSYVPCQMVTGMLKMQNPDETIFQSINFNFYTTSAVLQVRHRACVVHKLES